MSADLSSKILEAFFSFCGNAILLFWGSKIIAEKIEKYKADESLRVSIANETVREMYRVSKSLFHLEHQIEDMASKLAEYDATHYREEMDSHTKWAEFYRSLRLPLIEKQNETVMVIEECRFWIGKELYARYMKQNELLKRYFAHMDKREFLKAKEVWEEIDANRIYASHFLKK